MKNNNTNSTSSSPNYNSESPDHEPRDLNMGGNIFPVHDQLDNNIMALCMDHSSSSSSTSMPPMINTILGNNQFNPFPQLNNRYDDMTGATGTPCLFDVPACLTQSGGMGMGDERFYGDYGILLEPATGKIELEEGDFSLPPLESRSNNIEDQKNAANNNSIDNMKGNSNHHYNNNTCFNNTDIDQSFKVGVDMVGLENHDWQAAAGENLRMGEWDFEGFMDNISPFPNFLDFQV